MSKWTEEDNARWNKIFKGNVNMPEQPAEIVRTILDLDCQVCSLSDIQAENENKILSLKDSVEVLTDDIKFVKRVMKFMENGFSEMDTAKEMGFSKLSEFRVRLSNAQARLYKEGSK